MDEHWDSGDRMTPDDWRRQGELSAVHEKLREISDSTGGYRKGPYIGGSIDLAAHGVTLWWFGPLPDEARAVVEGARSEGITVTTHAASFSKAELDATLDRFRTRDKTVDIGLGFIAYNTDGSGFTVHFRTTPLALDGMRALDRIRALPEGQDPEPGDQPYVLLHAPTGPSITISPDPRSPTW